MKNSLAKRIVKMTAAFLSIVMLSSPVCAATFSDVPQNFWAYSSISKMADLGIMVGDSSGRYSPNQVIDKFYVSKAMAKAAGYKTIGFTAAEKTFQDNAYEANKSTLGLFKSNFTKWDSTADREIAYLLEKQVLTVDDLNRFVIKQSNGTETVRPLPKEEAAVFLVRLMGKQQDALSQNPASYTLFSDDAQISGQTKPFVYYMKLIGMLAGDAANRFNPQQNVTKAVFATMLNNAYSSIAKAETDPAPGGNTIESISGTIVDVYTSRNAIQIQDAAGEKSIHNVALGTSINIDGFVRTINELQKGMSFTAVLVNDEFTNFNATTAASAPTTTTTAASQTPVNVSSIEGTVSAVTQDQAARTISIDVRMLNTVGTVYTETRVFGLSSDCKITRGQSAVLFSEIAVGDIVSAQVSGNTVYSIEARQAEMNFSGQLLEKKVNDISGTHFYVIEDLNKKQHELIVTDETVIERAPSEYNLKWGDLRLGDKVDVKTKFNNITYIRGEGNRTNVEGVVKEMHIYENNQAAVLFRDSITNETKEYSLQSNIVDVYSIRIGDKLRLRLDSWEIDSYTKLENASNQNLTGKITTLRSQSFILTPTGQNSGTQISFDSNTYVYDAIARKAVTPSALMQNMELFVTYQKGSSNYASSITILNK